LPIEKKPIPSKDINYWTYHLTKGRWKDSHNVEPIMSPHNSKNKMLFYLVYPTPRPTFTRKKGLGKFLKPDHFTTYVFSKGVIIQWNFQNSWSPILEIEISYQWEGSACTGSALIFSFKFWGAGWGGFFSFFLCSHHVLIKFPLGSPCVPQECFMSAKFCPCINLCEKWWQTVLKREISWANGKAQHTLMNNSICFSLGGGGRGRDFLFFSLVLEVFPSCSHQILKVFQMHFQLCSQ